MSNAKQIDQLLEGFLKRGLPGCGLKVVQYGNTLYEAISVSLTSTPKHLSRKTHCSVRHLCPKFRSTQL